MRRKHVWSAMMHRLSAYVVALSILCGSAHTPAFAQDNSLTVFAAASLKNALDDIDAAYTAKTGVKVVASYAASSALANRSNRVLRQIFLHPPTPTGWIM